MVAGVQPLGFKDVVRAAYARCVIDRRIGIDLAGERRGGAVELADRFARER
jgi:hypothetical protein